MDTILITYGTRPFAQRLAKQLSSTFNCHFASSEPFPDILLKSNYRKIPTGPNPTFAHELLKLALDEGYQYILPLGKMELQPLHEARILLEEYGIFVLLPEELDNCPLIENPPSALDVRIVKQGLDLLSGEQLTPIYFSGATLLSDAGDEPALCIV